MPPRKKGKGKKGRKARAPPPERPIGREEGAASLDVHGHGLSTDAANIDAMMTNMRDMMISSLGDGYDAESLKILDRKMCEYFLSEDSIYYDSMYYGDKHIKRPNPDKPTDDEVLRYKSRLLFARVS